MWQMALCLTLCALLQFGSGLSDESTIYLIRHGEKVSSDGCLSKKGKERADHLVKIFDGSKFSTPNALFAYYYDKKSECERCLETVTPISKHLNLTPDHKHGGNSGKAAEAMLAELKKSSGTILVAWEHNHIKPLAEALGVHSDKIPEWSGDDFDSCYELKFDQNQKLTSFKKTAEDYHPHSNAMLTSSGQAKGQYLVFGDWGGRSEHEVTDAAQKAGAAGMAKVADDLGGIDFIISVGDHFYEGGIEGDAHNKRFKQTFEDVYHQPELQCPWYVVAGNHDHSGNITAQLEYSKLSDRWTYPHLWYTFNKSVTIDGKTITSQFVALDLIVMLGMHDTHTAVPGEHYWDMTPHPMQALADKQFAWFDKVMEASTADYLWVFGHYPMYNADGPHPSLVTKIGSQMTKYRASGYFAGHEHTMFEFTQALSHNDTVAYVVTGGGSRGVNKKVPPGKPFAGGVKWDWGHEKGDANIVSGFTSVLVSDKASTLRFHNEKGDVVHTSAIPPRF